jgi:DNA-binding winged helix-turn-helix (wHTH) protein/tetratricopeptide (TPR) repeat protein
MVKQVFTFAEFTFECDTGTLMRKRSRLHLSEQTARLLGVLLERANSLVSREELRQVLWPDEEFLDYDQGINVAVNRLRKALRDDSSNPHFLKTIPKRGYVFCGEVRLLSLDLADLSGWPDHSSAITDLERTSALLPEHSESVELDSPSTLPFPEDTPAVVGSGRGLGFPLRWTWFAVLLAILILTAGAWLIHMRQSRTTAPMLRLGIAPMRVKGDPQANDLAESFRLELSDAISRLPSVQVPTVGALGTSNAVDIPQISRELNLDDLLLGSIVKQGDQYDLKFELIRAADATHLASFEYSGPKKDLPSICERLQQDVFHYLQSKEKPLQTIKGSTNDAQAYELYLQGVYHLFERDPASMDRSLTEFRQATVRDPNFAAAYAGLATTYLNLSAYNTSPRDGLLSKAEEMAQHAVKLDPSLAQAHAVLGSTAYKKDRDFSRGEAELRNAIQIDPTQAVYRDWLSVLLVEEGRFDEALQQLDLAQTNAPFWPSVYAMEGLVGVYARRDATAIAAAKKYIELLPNLPIAHNTMAWVYFETGHYKDAIDEWRQMAILQNDQARVDLETRGMETFKTRGIRAYAQLRLDAIQSKRGIGQVNDFMPAEWYACAGKRDQAMAELERLASSQDPYMLHVGVDPLFDSFHQDPRFLALLATSGVRIPPALQNVNSHLCE